MLHQWYLSFHSFFWTLDMGIYQTVIIQEVVTSFNSIILTQQKLGELVIIWMHSVCHALAESWIQNYLIISNFSQEPGSRIISSEKAVYLCACSINTSLSTWESFCAKFYISDLSHINIYIPRFFFLFIYFTLCLILACIVILVSKCFVFFFEKPVHAASWRKIYLLVFHGISHFYSQWF